MSLSSGRPQSMVSRLVVCLLAAALFSIPAFASGNPPNGINIGFDFNWSNNGPAGYTASFIRAVSSSGATLNNCSVGTLTPSSTACDFAFTYSIGGVPQTSVMPGGVYGNFGSPGTCDRSPNNSAPLTLWNCFNTDSFGQIFLASASGALSGVTMQMTCLNPAGTPPTGLVALMYQVNAGGASIGATPLAQTAVNLSGCPTATSWTNKQFSAADFASIPLNFAGVNVTSGNFYAIYFGGPLVPGSTLSGIQPTPAPRSLILVVIALIVIGFWYRGRLLRHA